MTDETVFNDLFKVETPAVKAQKNPPVVTASMLNAPMPTPPAGEVQWSVKPGVNSKGTQFVVFKSKLEQQALNDILIWLHDNGNVPFRVLTTKLDGQSRISSAYHDDKQTWRDVVDGIIKDKIKGRGDYTVYQLKQITRLFAHVGFPALTFKKVK